MAPSDRGCTSELLLISNRGHARVPRNRTISFTEESGKDINLTRIFRDSSIQQVLRMIVISPTCTTVS